jgi:hypothetical protein
VLAQRLFTLPAASSPEEHRRACPRHAPWEQHAWLAWKTPHSIHRIPAQLLNISRGGAAVEVNSDIPADQVLSFGLGHADATASLVTATVVRVVTARADAHRVHLAFTTECPDAILKRALYGSRAATRHTWLAAASGILRIVTRRSRRGNCF